MMEERSTRSIASRLYLAGFLTAMLAAFLFETGLYFGSPYGLSDLPGAIGSGIALLPFAAIPVAIFTFVFLWPLTAIASQFCERIDEQRRWQVWVACGAAMGIPAMWFFAAILLLGFDLYFSISANGALLGAICAWLAWRLTRPRIDDTEGSDLESANGTP